MNTSRRTWLQRIAAFGAGAVALVPLLNRRLVAGPVTVEEARGLTDVLQRLTGLRLADPAMVLAESLQISRAVEELNTIAAEEDGRGDFFWGYSSNHAVESSPYYYSLWRCVRKGDCSYSLQGAEFFAHAPLPILLKRIEELKRGRPPRLQGHSLNVTYGRAVTLRPKSSADETDNMPYDVSIGGRYLLVQANALTHKHSGDIESFTQFYDMENPHQEIQAGMMLMALSVQYEIPADEAKGLCDLMKMIRTGTAFPPPPPEHPDQLITVHAIHDDPMPDSHRVFG